MPKDIPLGNLRRIGILRRTFCTYSLHLSERQNESRFVFPECPGYKKRIAICYPADPMNQNQNPNWLSYALHEAKNEFWFPFPCTPWSKIGTPISFSMYPMKQNRNSDFDFQVRLKQNRNSDFDFQVRLKQKMNSDFDFRHRMKPKMNSDFDFQHRIKPKMNSDFASSALWNAQNEFRFCFPECLWSKIEIHFWLHFFLWIGNHNSLNLSLRLRLYAPHFVSPIDEWRWMTNEDQGDDRHQIGRMDAGSYLGLHGVCPNRRRDLFRPSSGAAE